MNTSYTPLIFLLLLLELSVRNEAQEVCYNPRFTQQHYLGPYFVPNAPVRQITCAAEKLDTDKQILLNGTVSACACESINYRPICKQISGAKIEFWQANSSGVYDHLCRQTIYTAEDGSYTALTTLAGRYRSMLLHIHFRISFEGYVDFPRIGKSELSEVIGQLNFQEDTFLSRVRSGCGPFCDNRNRLKSSKLCPDDPDSPRLMSFNFVLHRKNEELKRSYKGLDSIAMYRNPTPAVWNKPPVCTTSANDNTCLQSHGYIMASNCSIGKV